MTSNRRFTPPGLLLPVIAAAAVVWASTGAAVAQDKSTPAKQDAKAQQATKTKQNAASAKPGAPNGKRISQRPLLIPPKRQIGPGKRGVRSKAGSTVPTPTVVLKAGEVPNISFDTPNYNFGRVRAGQPIKHVFWFTNTGTGPLEILRVKPS